MFYCVQINGASRADKRWGSENVCERKIVTTTESVFIVLFIELVSLNASIQHHRPLQSIIQNLIILTHAKNLSNIYWSRCGTDQIRVRYIGAIDANTWIVLFIYIHY